MIQKHLKNLLNRRQIKAPHRHHEKPAGAIRVLTYNIHHGEGVDGRYDLERIAEVIASEAPDVVALQEIERFRRRTHHDDQPKLLASMLSMHYCFAPVRDHRHTDHHSKAAYGNAILTRYDILSTSHFDLSIPGAREPRGCLHTLVRTSAGLLHVFCVHLGLRRSERAQQMALLASSSILKNPRLTPAPAVLLGDFNNWWPVRTARHIQKQFVNACHVTGRRRLLTFGSPLTFLALDYVYATPDIRILNCYVSRSRKVRVASDHRPLVSDLLLLPRHGEKTATR